MNMTKILKLFVGMVVCLLLVSVTLNAVPQCHKTCSQPCDMKAKEEKKSDDVKISPEKLLENIQKKTFVGDSINVCFKDAPMVNVIKFFGKCSGLEFQVEPGVEGVVSIEKKQVPWDEAFHAILENNKLQLVFEDNALKIRKIKK